MPKKDAPAVRILDLVSQFLRKQTDADIERFLSGQLRLGFIETAPAASRNSTRLQPQDMDDLAKALASAIDRDDARQVVEERKLRAIDLRALAKYLDIPLTQSDTVDRITGKIVESTVGFRIRSRAIRREHHDSGDE